MCLRISAFISLDKDKAEMTTVAIMQSNYIPWKGYFDLARASDVFVILDQVQYTKNDWRNRNQILMNGQPLWLTIPVIKGKLGQLICETRVQKGWHRKHLKSLQQAYARAPFFELYKDKFEHLYQQAGEKELLSDINRVFIQFLFDCLAIKTPIYQATEDDRDWNASERVLRICKRYKATRYLSGPSASDYLDTQMLMKNGIETCWATYSGYPDYPQLSKRFTHAVSVLDLLFNTGGDAVSYMKDVTHE